MKKLISGIAVLAFLLLLPLHGSWIVTKTFLATAENVDASATATNGTHFTSTNVDITFPTQPPRATPTTVAVTVTFTRAAGSASLVYFEFQGSYDNGTSYSTVYLFRIEVATNSTAVSNVVRYTTLVNVYGISHLRLYQIVNNDSSNNITSCNAYVSW